MKHILYGIVAGMCALLAFAAMLTIDTVHSRQKELDNALALSCDELMKETYDSLDYLTVTEDEFLYDFEELMEDKICLGGDSRDPNLSLEVDVAALDLTDGLFSVKVTEYFTYPNGIRGKVTSKKTAIYEESVYAV